MAGPRIIDKDLGWAEFFKTIHEIKDARIKVGVLDSSGGGEKEPGSDITLAQLAGVLEFGTEDGRIPSRSVVRSAFDEEREKLVRMGADLIGQVLDLKMSLDRALGVMGLYLVTAMKRKIVAGVPPPNAPSTVMQKLGRKGRRTAKTLGQALSQVGQAASVKPWIDRGRLLAAFTWAIVKPGEGEE